MQQRELFVSVIAAGASNIATSPERAPATARPKPSKYFDPKHPGHRALFMDAAWLYALSLVHASAHVRAVHVSHPDTAPRQYLFGGQMALQEKQQSAAVLSRLAPKGAGTDDVLPSWYPQLLDLLTRHLRRPYVMNDELRYAEWVVEAQLVDAA